MGVGGVTEANDSSDSFWKFWKGSDGPQQARREEGWAGKVTQWEGCLFVVERIRGGRLRKARQRACAPRRSADQPDRSR